LNADSPPRRPRLGGALLARLYNVQPVGPGMYRCAQIYGAHLPAVLNHLGIRCLINLRGDDPGKPWHRNETRVCQALGVARVSVGLNSKWIPRQYELIELLEAFAGAPRPMLMKCSGGADRTSFASALFLLDEACRHGPPPDLAAVVARACRQIRLFPYLHLPKKHQRWLKVFFQFYLEDHGGRTPLAWLRERYRWERFARYMMDRGLEDYWAGPRLDGGAAPE